jgi:amino acid adenylation domain-containing protein
VQAEQGARALHARGVRPGDAVGVLMERGVDMVVAVLAALFAGAAYVAVDARYPAPRQAHMLRTARTGVVIGAEGGPAEVVAQVEGATAVTVAALLAEAPDMERRSAPAPAVTAQDRASILFTSGTTGRPKGVELLHRGLVNFATNPALPTILPTDRMGQVSSVSFDAFHYELWCALAAGAEVVVLPNIPDLLSRDPGRELRRRRISAMLVPTMAVNHLAKEDRETFSSLRVLCTGGDVLLARACREIMDSRFAGEFYNLYGPTEASTACTAHRVDPDVDPDAPVPIGRPLANCFVRLLDEDHKPVPDGEPGQLFVGGAGVARGYLDMPEETAARFVEDPLGERLGRLYATGDMARLRPDGLLEFLGRSDDQAKIRGYRVEPFEVDRTLRAHPMVEDSAVVLHGEGDGKQLAAFVVLGKRGTPGSVREYLRERLPDYAVPSVLLKLDQIPATENGKRDVEALREMLSKDLHRRSLHRKPDTESERYLAELFEELLGVERVGTDDDFFALGGHSLMAFRLHRRITRDLGGDLPFEDVLRYSKVRDLAAAIDRGRSPGRTGGTVRCLRRV